MPTLIAKRIGSMVVITICLAGVLFYLQKISPLDPVRARLGGQASAASVAAERHNLGLDRPITAQFGDYLKDLVQGNLGDSYRTRKPVRTDLGHYLPATAELAFAAITLAVVLGALLAFAMTLRWRVSKVIRPVMLLGASTPTFLLGIGGILIFYSQLGWLPANGRTDIGNAPDGPTGFLTLDGILTGRFDVTVDAVQHLILPTLALALGPAVAIARVLRSSLVTDQRSDYVRTARAKGLSEPRILVIHVLRNAMGAALSMTGLQVGLMFAGVLVVEQVFSWPGIGQYVAQSIPVADFPAIAGVTLLLGVGYVVINTIVDLLQAAADPRIQL